MQHITLHVCDCASSTGVTDNFVRMVSFHAGLKFYCIMKFIGFVETIKYKPKYALHPL